MFAHASIDRVESYNSATTAHSAPTRRGFEACALQILDCMKTILYATDFSPASDAAFEQAMTLAKRSGAHLIVAHVRSVPDNVWYPSVAAVHDLDKHIEAASLAALAKLRDVAQRRGVDAAAISRVGVPWDAICALAEETDADLVVLGTHGASGVRHALIGSVAERVVRASTRPVLTVRSAEADAA